MAALIIRLPDGKRERLKDLARARKQSVTKLFDEMATVLLAEYDAETRFRVRAGDEVAVAPRLQPSHERRAGEAAMAGDIDARVRRHAAILAGRCRNQGQTTISGSTAS